MRIERVGYGAGETELAWPNVLRLWLGQPVAGDGEGPPDEHVVLETNVDDMSPQLLRLKNAGADHIIMVANAPE